MRITSTVLLVGGTAILSACFGNSMMVGPLTSADAPTVIGVSPANATIVAAAARPVVVTFSRPMMAGMEALVVLHDGGVTGSPVAGIASWSADRTIMTFTPSAPLRAGTTWTLHFSPGIRSLDGGSIDLAACTRLGGRYATAGMMGVPAGAGMMNGAWGPGMMGEGWRSPDGTYGMIFTFTTA